MPNFILKPFCKMVFIILILLTSHFLSLTTFTHICNFIESSLDSYYITNSMSYDDEWSSGGPLKWYEKIIIGSVITLCIFAGIYMSIWIASVELNVYVLFILWVFICVIILTMFQVKRSINHGK